MACNGVYKLVDMYISYYSLANVTYVKYRLGVMHMLEKLNLLMLPRDFIYKTIIYIIDNVRFLIQSGRNK